ncbi:KR domain-containing protein [Xylogone sp. PMI_703]|nr:KR domain-containing protein [Xylogone sp. PMI_703]
MIQTPVAALNGENLEKSKVEVDVSHHQKYPSHELLGSRVLEDNSTQLSWKSILDVKELSWLSEHVLLNQILYPAAGYIAMAGEAMRQLSDGNLESYTLRDFAVTSALLLKPDEKVEIRTTLQPVKVEGETGQWYEMQIISNDGSRWVERCVSKVSTEGISNLTETDALYPKDTLLRNVPKGYWYDIATNVGLNYGTAFQGLDEISASVAETKAAAAVSPSENATKYGLHPVTIDLGFQTLAVAACQGQGRRLDELSTLSAIKHLVIAGGEFKKLTIQAAVTKAGPGGITGNVSGLSENGTPVFSMRECRTSVVPVVRAEDESRIVSFIEWETDVTFANPNKSLAPFHPQLDYSILLERLTLLLVFNMKAQGIQNAVKKQGRFGIISDISPFAGLDAATRTTMIQELKEQIRGTSLAPVAVLVERLLTSGAPFSGDSSEKKRILNQCYPLARNNGVLAHALKLLAHKTPRLRVLELGNGAAETTGLILNALESQYGEHMYHSYTYATSSAATAKAKEALKGSNDINVVSFDAEKPLQGQNVQAGTYDLVITTDFFSPAKNLKTSVNHLKTLVSPSGRLVVLDTLLEPEWAILVKGYLSKSTPPSASRDPNFIRQVHAALEQDNFEFGTDGEISPTSVKLVAGLKKAVKPPPKKVTFIAPDHDHPLVKAVQTSFQQAGIASDKCTFESTFPAGQDIISLIDFGNPYVHDLDEAKFSTLVARLSGFKGSLVWVTPSAQTSCSNPNSSMILGLARTLRAELRKDLTVVEIDVDSTAHTDSSKLLLKIYQSLGQRPKSKDVDPDYEYAIVDSDIKIPRLHYTSPKEELSRCGLQSPSGSVSFRSDAFYLLVGGLGGLGRAIATWMVDNGARNILFLSRSAKEGPETTPFFNELRSRGCAVSTFAGSVNNLTDVVAAVKQVTLPLAGIMQMSAVMRDNWLSQMTYSEWEQCVNPKVQGTWNLHQAASSSKLDFFLLFSSICGISGQWGQANYNAANAFLDAFVNYRHGQNLPASVVDIGFMGSIGMAVENSALVDKLKGSGYYYLTEKDLIDSLSIAIAHSQPRKDRFRNKSQHSLGLRSTTPLTNVATRVVWKKDARTAISHGFGTLGAVTDEKAKESLIMAYQKGGN